MVNWLLGTRIVILGLLLTLLAGCGSGQISPTTTLSPQASPTTGNTATATVVTTVTVPAAPTATSAVPTLSPTTRAPTSTAPAVPSSTPTAVAAVKPAATPSGSPVRYPVAPVFQKVATQDFKGGFMGAEKDNYLGDPVEAAHDTKLAEQSFGNYGNGTCSSADSRFLWREDTQQIYFLIEGNFGLHAEACRDFWQVFKDTWKTGDPNNDDLTAPPGTVVPRGGFGKVWRDNFYGKSLEGLGFPKIPERYTTGTVQRFDHGTAFYLADSKAVYVLFDDFAYYTRSGETSASVWFEAE